MFLMDNNEDSVQALSLESQLERIAIENDVLANLLETFKTVIPNFVSQLRNTNAHFVETNKEQSDVDVKLSTKEKDVIEAARHIDYLNFGERPISIPEGFKGNLLKYAELLEKITAEAYQAQNTILAEYNGILSSFITNKEDKISLKDHTSFFERIKNRREELSKELSSFANSTTGVSKAKFKSVVGRMAEIEPLFKQAARLTGNHSAAKLNEIHSAVNHSVDLLDIVIKGVTDGKITHISGNATQNIAKGAYEVAKYVEFVGIIYFDVTVFLNTLNGVADAILNVNKE